MPNDRVLPFFKDHGLPVLHILSDRSTEYFGKAEHHDYQLSQTLNDDRAHQKQVRSWQSNTICERFHKTILQEFYQVTFRK